TPQTQARPAGPAGQPAAALIVGHEKPVNAVTFSPDGRWLATGSADSILSIWDAGTGQPGPQQRGLRGLDITSVAFAPDSTRLAPASKDGNGRVWDTASGQELGKYYSGGMAFVYGVAFSPDGRWLATACGSRPARIWDVASKKIVRDLAVR